MDKRENRTTAKQQSGLDCIATLSEEGHLSRNNITENFKNFSILKFF